MGRSKTTMSFKRLSYLSSYQWKNDLNAKWLGWPFISGQLFPKEMFRVSNFMWQLQPSKVLKISVSMELQIKTFCPSSDQSHISISSALWCDFILYGGLRLFHTQIILFLFVEMNSIILSFYSSHYPLSLLHLFLSGYYLVGIQIQRLQIQHFVQHCPQIGLLQDTVVKIIV